MTTTSLPLISGRFATSSAAQTAAPDEMPTSSPSSVASRRAVVLRWISGLAGFSNCWGMKLRELAAASSCAFFTAPALSRNPCDCGPRRAGERAAAHAGRAGMQDATPWSAIRGWHCCALAAAVQPRKAAIDIRARAMRRSRVCECNYWRFRSSLPGVSAARTAVSVRSVAQSSMKR